MRVIAEGEPHALLVTQPRYFHEAIIAALPSKEIAFVINNMIRNQTFGKIPHYGLNILAGFIADNGLGIRVAGLFDKDLVERVTESQVALLSVMDIGLDQAEKIARAAKGKTNLIIGGYGVNYHTIERLTATGATLMVGEAEGVLEELIDDLSKGGPTKSVYQRKELYDLSRSGEEPYQKPEIAATIANLHGTTNIKAIELSRGCKEGCEFCSTAGQRVRVKPLNVAIQEIERMKPKPWDILFFVDQNLMNCPNDYLAELFCYINSKNYYWTAEGTITNLYKPGLGWDEKLLREMSKKCLGFLVGIEDLENPTRGSPTKSDIARGRKITLPEIARVMREVKLPIIYSLMFGTDEQHAGCGARTAELVNNLGITVAAHIATPRTGTAFWDKVNSTGRLVDNRSQYRNMRFSAVHNSTHLTRDEILKEFMVFQENVYSKRKVIERFVNNLIYGGKRYAGALLITDLIYFVSTNAFRWIHPEISKEVKEMARRKQKHTLTI